MKSHVFLRHLVPISAATLLMGALLQPSQAHACSYPAPEPGFEDGDPRADATDVPTDVILYYPIPVGVPFDSTEIPGAFTFQTEDGAPVAITTRRAGEWGYELVPDEPLAPSTSYVLTGTWPFASSEVTKTLRFTTGAGPLQELPAAPTAKLEHYRIVQAPINSCSPPQIGSCLSFGDPEPLIEVTHIDEFDQLMTPYLTRRSFFTNLSGIEQGTNFKCARLRTRAANGTYGEERTLCGVDAELTEVSSEQVECTAEGITVSGALIGREPPDASGMTAGAGGGAVEPMGSGGAPADDAGMPAPSHEHGEGDAPFEGDDDAAQEPAEPVLKTSGCAVSGPRSNAMSLHALGCLIATAFLACARLGTPRSIRARRRSAIATPVSPSSHHA